MGYTVVGWTGPVDYDQDYDYDEDPGITDRCELRAFFSPPQARWFLSRLPRLAFPWPSTAWQFGREKAPPLVIVILILIVIVIVIAISLPGLCHTTDQCELRAFFSPRQAR